ncbi:hypothetical protein [Dysgonomonas sp. UBA7698]|uniref:hypothetical protein n=1 Tax=Dysgonomonas sp. UBA7698 TaxID=1946427 RepID=UPI0025BABF88|nr:hypothetical protein [Dysgonomonas sp. UBA7698]
MDKRAQIAQQLSQLMSAGGVLGFVFAAKVIEVNGLTCTIDYDGLKLTDVRLLPTTTVDGDRALLIPAKDTYVLVISDGGDLSSLWIAKTDVLEKIEIMIGDVSVVADKDGVILNGGSLGGMVKIKPLISKLNTLENSVNALKAVFAGWSPVSQDGGAALKAAISQWAGQPVSVTKIGDLENEKVKQ